MTVKISPMHQKVIDQNKHKVGISKNAFWDEASNHYKLSIAAINQVEGTLSEVLVEVIQNPEKLAKIEDQAALANNVTVLNKDIIAHTERLNTIYAKHSHKKGGTTTPDEVTAVLSLHGEYSDALEVYQANIMPIVQHILEQISQTEDAQEQEEQKLLDPTVISDVAFTDAPKPV